MKYVIPVRDPLEKGAYHLRIPPEENIFKNCSSFGCAFYDRLSI
jgi:hypothetical protein